MTETERITEEVLARYGIPDEEHIETATEGEDGLGCMRGTVAAMILWLAAAVFFYLAWRAR